MDTNNNMIKVKIDGKEYEYEYGTPYSKIAYDRSVDYKDDILLVKADNKLKELHKKLTKDCELKMITARDKPGMQTYERSATLLMLKAFYDTVGASRISKLSMEYSIGNGIFVRAKGDFTLDQNLINLVREKMIDMVEKAIPIMKKSVSTSDAIDLFHKHKMYDKERLFNYRRLSKVNIYTIGSFEDYFYGYMVQNTSYIKYFDLSLYHEGFVLELPTQDNPSVIPEFKPSEKLFAQLYESTMWGDKLKLGSVGELNDQIAQGGAGEMILIQEALMEKRIGDLAETIASNHDKKLVMIAGPSSSGKTTFSHRLSIQLRAKGLIPHPIEVDNYFKNRVDTPKNPDGSYNFESLDAMDIETFNKDMTALIEGKEVELPNFNFKKGVREYSGDSLKLGEHDILVIEGIHCLNDKLSYSLPKEKKYKIYISALTQLNVDEHNRIHTSDGRLIRRMVRDARTRGAGARQTLSMWLSVRRGEEENIFPYQDDADVVFNSALIYELAVLKQYAEPLLFGIPKDCEEYVEAKRLLKFLDYFLAIPSESIPHNSILREFIGGSCFNV